MEQSKEEKRVDEVIQKTQENVEALSQGVSNTSDILLAVLLIAAGLVFCSTFIGAIIGIPMVIYGAYLWIKVRSRNREMRRKFLAKKLRG